MMRYAPLTLIFLLTFVVSVGCSERPAVVETDTYQPSEIDKEMESEEYEKAMNEMANQQ